MQSIERRKVLIIVPTVSAGGSERFVSILFNQLDRTKFDVKLVVLDSTHIFYELAYKKDILLLNKKDVRSSFLILIKIIRSESPHIILSTITSLNILLTFIRICYPKFLLIIRESTILSTHFRNIKYAFLYEIPIKILYKFADKVICQSEDMLKDLNKNYRLSAKKLVVINNPALVNKFTLKEKKWHSKARLITIARLDKAKGYERVIRALALVKVDFEYVVVGDFSNNSLRNEFDALASSLAIHNKIRVIGTSTTPEKYLQESDIYLHGSFYEGFPNALLEAGLVGLPVVSFNTAGTGDILIDQVNSFIVPDNDLIAYAKAIEKATQHGFDNSKIRELITTRFDSKIIMEKYETLFSSI